MSGTCATADASASGLRETGREALTFSGMGGAVFDDLPPLEAVHFDQGADSGNERHDEVRTYVCLRRFALAQADLDPHVIMLQAF